MLEKVEVAAPLTYWERYEVEDAGKAVAYSRSKMKVSQISRMMSMAADWDFCGPSVSRKGFVNHVSGNLPSVQKY